MEDQDLINLSIPKNVWKLPSSWTYNLNVNSIPQSVGVKSLNSFIERAINQWIEATNKKINLTRGKDIIFTKARYDNQNIIAWGNAPRGALAVTYIWYDKNTNIVVDSDTIMNEKYLWSWYDSTTCAYKNSYDAENILAHELGHWFGLNDVYDSNYRYATMFGYGYKGEKIKSTLTTGDKNTVYSIYNP